MNVKGARRLYTRTQACDYGSPVAAGPSGSAGPVVSGLQACSWYREALAISSGLSKRTVFKCVRCTLWAPARLNVERLSRGFRRRQVPGGALVGARETAPEHLRPPCLATLGSAKRKLICKREFPLIRIGLRSWEHKRAPPVEAPSEWRITIG